MQAYSTNRWHIPDWKISQGTLLTAISQYENRNIFPLAFAIDEGEMKEAMIWFFQLLCEYVTPQPNICLITDRGKVILSTLQSPNIAWGRKWPFLSLLHKTHCFQLQQEVQKC